MYSKKEKVEQPTLEEQRLLNNVAINSVDTVEVRGKEWKIRWLRGFAIRKVTDIMLQEPKINKFGQDISSGMDGCKCAAAIKLNSWLGIKLLYWFLWRWFYYVKQYGFHELFPVIELAQKKMAFQSQEYQRVIIYLTALKDTKMMMTKKEVEATQQGLSSGKGGK